MTTTIIIIVSVLVILIVGLLIFLKSKNKIETNEEVVDKKPQSPRERPQARPTRTPPPRREVKPEFKEETKPAKELPKGEYPQYDHSRMINDLGLGEEDAVEFIADLISQIDTTIPQIQSAINSKDYETMESLTHGIKGSATNLGTGGVASVLVDFNTYLKTDKDMDIINSYFGHLKSYSQQLKEQYA